MSSVSVSNAFTCIIVDTESTTVSSVAVLGTALPVHGDSTLVPLVQHLAIQTRQFCKDSAHDFNMQVFFYLPVGSE